MASNKTKVDDGAVDSTATPVDIDEVFRAAAENPANQEIERFVAPDQSQWRRKLNEHELLAWVAMQANLNNGEDTDAGLRMFAQIAQMESLSEALSGKVDTTKSREILNTVMSCHSIKFMNGDQPDGCPYFAIVEVKYGANNEKDTLSIGGWMAIAQLGRTHYESTEFPPDSTYLVHQGHANGVPKESYPHYFQIKQKPTPNGHMNYLASAIG